MPRVAFLIDTISSPTAGTEKQLLLLLRSLAREQIEPVLCCLYSSEWLDQKFDLCPKRILDIASFKDVRLPAKIGRFCAFLRDQKIDIIQTQFRDSNYVGILAAKLAGVHAIISTRRGMPYWRNRLELSLIRRFNSAVHVFVANSRSTSALFCAREGIPPEKMKVIYNGVDVSDYPTDEKTRTASRTQLGFDPETRIAGIIANLRPVKGIDVFLRAASLVKKKFAQVKFVIIGEGNEKGSLMAMAGELGIGSDVVFLGQRGDIPRLLPALDIGVLSSHYESFSNSIIEYGAASLPSVCTDVGGAREVIVEGETGYLVPAGDAEVLADRLIRLFNTPSLRQMGILARKRIQDFFSISSTAQQYQELYLQLADSNKSLPDSKTLIA